MSVTCSFEVTCWERSDLLAFLYVMFSCIFVTFLYGVLGQVCYLIVSIPDLCLLSTLVSIKRTVNIVARICVQKVCFTDLSLQSE